MSGFCAILIFSLMTLSTAASSADKAYQHLVINFEKGESSLSKQEKENLRKFLMRTQKNGKVSQVELAAWSDKKLPQTVSLPKDEQALADQRAQSVEKEIASVMGDKPSVKVYNMAKNANFIERLGRTKKAKAVPSYEPKAGDRPATADVSVIKQSGGPSKVLVLLEQKGQRTSE